MGTCVLLDRLPDNYLSDISVFVILPRMFEEIPIITTSQYRAEATKWLGALKRGESACVTFIPKTDRFIRIGQLLKDTELLKDVLGSKQQYIFQRLYFDPHDAEDMDDLEHQLAEHLSFARALPANMPLSKWMDEIKQRKTRLVYVIADAEKFLKPETKHVLSLLSRIVEEYEPYVQLLMFFEEDITLPENMQYLPASTRIYENIFPYPLYDAEETKKFIHMLSVQWGVKPDERTVQSIVDGCSGHFWLVKEAMREIVSDGQWSPVTPGMLFRVRMVFTMMHDSTQELLRKMVAGETSLTQDELHTQEYLRRMRFFTGNDKVPTVFEQFILNRYDVSDKLQMQDNRLVLQEMPLNAFLSRKEYRVMKHFIQKRGMIVTRDDIARQLWPSDTKAQYSDWAIDQMIARLRKKMTQLSLNPKLLKTLRGKGYMLAIS